MGLPLPWIAILTRREGHQRSGRHRSQVASVAGWQADLTTFAKATVVRRSFSGGGRPALWFAGIRLARMRTALWTAVALAMLGGSVQQASAEMIEKIGVRVPVPRKRERGKSKGKPAPCRAMCRRHPNIAARRG